MTGHNGNPPDRNKKRLNPLSKSKLNGQSSNSEPSQQSELVVDIDSYFTYGCFIPFLSSEKFLNRII